MATNNPPLDESPFATLTSVCFTKLCTHLSINDLFSCAQVNRHWRAEVTSYFLTVRSILIISPAANIPQTEQAFYLDAYNERLYRINAQLEQKPESKQQQYRFECQRLTATFARHFAHLFCHLKQLNFHFDLELTSATLNGLLRLLAHLQPHLTSLSLHIREFWTPKVAQRALFSQLNRMRALRRLSLDLGGRIRINIRLRALAWLREFSFACVDQNDLVFQDARNILYHSLYRFAAHNPHLAVIRYKCQLLAPCVPCPPFTSFFISTPRGRALATRMSQFELAGALCFFHSTTYCHFISHFTSFTHLKLNVRFIEWHPTLHQLRHLTQLEDLRIYLNISPRRLVEQDRAAVAQDGPFLSLPSVRTLVLSSSFLNHHNKLTNMRLGHYFPHLSRFQFNWIWSAFQLSSIVRSGNLPFEPMPNPHTNEPLCRTCFPYNNEDRSQMQPLGVWPRAHSPDDPAYREALRIRENQENERFLNRIRFDLQTHREEFEQCARALLGPWRDSPTLKWAGINNELVELAQLFSLPE